MGILSKLFGGDKEVEKSAMDLFKLFADAKAKEKKKEQKKEVEKAETVNTQSQPA